MIIQNATYNIIYPQSKNIRKDIFSLEENLKGLFLEPFSLIPVPEDAPPEIPRIQATSESGHSTLNISGNSAQISANYDSNYNKNIDLCLGYLSKRALKTFEGIKGSTNNEYLFSGLTVNIIFDELNDKDPINLIKSNFFNIKSEIKPFDINNKVTYILDDKYYLNITCSNIRSYEGLMLSELNTLANAKEVGHFIGVTLDINDRYAFNYKNGYRSNINELEKIINIAIRVLKEKIHKYILEGVFEYDN